MKQENNQSQGKKEDTFALGSSSGVTKHYRGRKLQENMPINVDNHPDALRGLIEEKLEEMVKIGILKATNKKGERAYIYPPWLIPYSEDRKLMKGILSIRDKSLKEAKLLHDEVLKSFTEKLKDNITNLNQFRVDEEKDIFDEIDKLLKEEIRE